MNSHKRLEFKEITSAPYAFLWGVDEKGYKLGNRSTYDLAELLMERPLSVEQEAPWLVPQGRMVNRYPPLSKLTLHREFARLNSDDSILEFATKYGLLGQKQNSVPVFPRGGGELILAEPVARWQNENRNIGRLLAVWDLIKREEAGKLGQIVKWLPDGSRVYIEMYSEYNGPQREWQIHPFSLARHQPQPGCLTDIIADAHMYAEAHALWRRGDLFEPARYYILREVNKHLKEHVAPQAVLPKGKGGIPAIYLWPDSLLAAFWVLFLTELMGQIRVRPCDYCHEWSGVNLKRDPFYCSAKCRVAAWKRGKKKRAADNERTHNQAVQE